MWVVERCVKPPGLIFAARTYRLVLNNKGLYLIHIGRAMGPKVGSNSAMADRIAEGVISRMEQNLMQKLANREAELDDNDLDKELPRSSKSRHFSTPNEVELELIPHPNGSGKLRLKGKGVKLGLEILPQDISTIETICAQFKA